MSGAVQIVFEGSHEGLVFYDKVLEKAHVCHDALRISATYFVKVAEQHAFDKRRRSGLRKPFYDFDRRVLEILGAQKIAAVDRRLATRDYTPLAQERMLREMGNLAARRCVTVTTSVDDRDDVCLKGSFYVMSPEEAMKLRRYIRGLEEYAHKYQVGPDPIVEVP